MEDSEQMDLADFDTGQHAGVILDELVMLTFSSGIGRSCRGASKLSRVPDRHQCLQLQVLLLFQGSGCNI